jgi:hypothetical protein
MSSQKNEAMNKSIMRYAPKDKTYARTMTLTSRINIAIGIDCIGHARYYERLFRTMNFRHTALTFSGLQRMWRKKEYRRMYSGLKRVHLACRLAARTKLVDGIAKIISDKKEGRGYSSGRRMKQEGEGEHIARKKARVNNPLTAGECKCGSRDHQRVTSKSCPYFGLTKSEVSKNYENRLKECEVIAIAMATPCTVQSTSKFLAPMRTRKVAAPNIGRRQSATQSHM